MRKPRFTFRPGRPEDDKFLRAIRRAVSRVNAEVPGPIKLRVSLAPVGGVHPDHAWKYENRFSRRVKIEDSERVAVYVTPAARSVRRHEPVRGRVQSKKAVERSRKA